MNDGFTLKSFSLRNRIFFSLIFLSIVSSILISTVSVYQFREEAKTYHQYRLEQKEASINENINYILTTAEFPLETKYIPQIFKDKIHEIAAIHNTEINIHDLNGKLLSTSKGTFTVDRFAQQIPIEILQNISRSLDNRHISTQTIDGKTIRISYTYLKDNKFKPLGILTIPYEENRVLYQSEVRNFMIKFGQVYIIMLILSVLISYFLSNYIIQNLRDISNKIKKTTLGKKNEKIKNTSSTREIAALIDAYNGMVDKLEDSYEKLAQNERERAWREMAKQVAHEVKNPLTPMRLTVQSFVRRFDPNDPNIVAKVNDLSKVLIQQIDTMSAVATAFSSFASMPAQQNETLDVVATVKLSLDLFNDDNINFYSNKEKITSKIDRTQLIRIITNLVKNALQAMPEDKLYPEVSVNIEGNEDNVMIHVTDNGTGIPEEIRDKVFNPKFTTKTSGMGLGLGIIKNIVENYNGTITFETEINKGTTFTVTLPIINT